MELSAVLCAQARARISWKPSVMSAGCCLRALTSEFDLRLPLTASHSAPLSLLSCAIMLKTRNILFFFLLLSLIFFSSIYVFVSSLQNKHASITACSFPPYVTALDMFLAFKEKDCDASLM